MKIKTTVSTAIATLIALGAAPLTSEAATGPNAALDACVKSFVETYLPERKVRQVAKPVTNPNPLSLFSAREYTVVLSARGVESGDVIAEARCVASRHGIVVVLDSQVAAKHKQNADFFVSVR